MFHRLFLFKLEEATHTSTYEKNEMAKKRNPWAENVEEVYSPNGYKYSHTLIVLFLSYYFERHRIVGSFIEGIA